MTQSTDEELDRFFETYREAYTNLDIDAIVDHYTVPMLSVTEKGLYWLSLEEDVRKVMGAYLDTLREREYDRGRIDSIAYHHLTDRDVIASSTWTRFTTDDEVLERLGTTYLLRRTDEGWQIAMTLLHGPGTALD